MTKLLITGGSGFLGCRLAYFLKEKYDLLLPTHDALDISREEAVRAYLEEHRPQAVIHCAALSNTWHCEQHPDASHRVNVQGTVRVAKACKAVGARLLFMSSDQVYNGTPTSGPLPEDALLQPVNVYGRHKLEAEQRALRNLPDAVGLRLTWMYDLPGSRMRQNTGLPLNLKKACDEGTEVRAATHECRGVTYVWDVVRNIEKALALPGGIYNFGCGNALSSHALFLAFARAMNLSDPDGWILPDPDRFAAQPRNLVMDGTRAEHHGIHFPDSTEDFREALCHPFRTP
ncbi:MAG: sugar nucleotide-binding protein [Bacteroidales bacterium]|nr:sugar nucleotide-binding protein [Bacteroidales bacterium]